MLQAERGDELRKPQRGDRTVRNPWNQKVTAGKESVALQLQLPSQGKLKQTLHLTPGVSCGGAYHFFTLLLDGSAVVHTIQRNHCLKLS